jgi:hypothetical protein
VGFLLVLGLTLSISVLVAGVVIFLALRRSAPLRLKREQACAGLCTQRGLEPGVTSGDFAILGPIDPRWLTNAFSTPDHGVAIADFCRPAGKELQFFSVLAFTLAGLNLPYVAVTRRDLAGITVGGPPTLELESTEFDKSFTVKAKDRRCAVMLLDPGMMQLLLDCADVSFSIVGDRVLAFINRAAEPAHQPTEPVEFELLLRFWDGFILRVPQLLRSEYGAEQS